MEESVQLLLFGIVHSLKTQLKLYCQSVTGTNEVLPTDRMDHLSTYMPEEYKTEDTNVPESLLRCWMKMPIKIILNHYSNCQHLSCMRFGGFHGSEGLDVDLGLNVM
jgi:hypothetical protein